MKENIVFISGTLSTPSFWSYQESFFKEKYNIHYIADLSKGSIGSVAEFYKSKLPEKFSLIGFSMGGYVALELMRLIPEKINKLILINTSARKISNTGLIHRERSIRLIKENKFEFLVRNIFKKSFYSLKKYEIYSSLLITMANDIGADNYIKQLMSVINKPDHSNVLKDIKCPSLIIFGEDDRVMPVDGSRDLAKNIGGSDLVSIGSCGHMMPLENKEEMTEIIGDWL